MSSRRAESRERAADVAGRARRPRRRRGLALSSAGAAALAGLLVTGCAYFNALYNANRLFDEAEAARWSGQRSTAQAKYQAAIERAGRSFRTDPDGRWADDALVLMGRAYLHRGEWEKAEGAFNYALSISDDSEMRARARVYLGALLVATGRPSRGVATIDEAIEDVGDRGVRAEGYLWRARGNLRAGSASAGFRDLDRASGQGREAVRMAAELERLVWGVEGGDTAQAFRAGRRLMGSESGRDWADSLAVAAERATRIFGPEAGVRLLEGAETAPWPPPVRDQLILRRARLVAQVGDTARALADVRRVAGGVGRLPDQARVLQARWRLPAVDDVEELDEIRSLLLPAVGSREAVALLDQIKKVGLMVEQGGRGEVLAFFAAAEMARDSLGAPRLARELFEVYSRQDRGSTWEAKALLAALQLPGDPERNAELKARLDELPENIYIRAANRTDERELDYLVIERRLRTALANVKTQVAAEAETRDVVVADMARTLDSIRTAEDIARRIAEGDSALIDSLRQDSIRQDSIRQDSIRRADSIRRDTAFFGPDSTLADTLPDTTGVSRRLPAARPLVIRYRDQVSRPFRSGVVEAGGSEPSSPGRGGP